MYENYQRRRPSHNDAVVRNREVHKSNFFLTGFQIIMCVIGLVAAFAISKSSSGFYTSAKGFAKSALNSNITNAQVAGAFDTIRDGIRSQVPDAAEVFKNSASSASSKSSSSGSSSSKPSSSKSAASSKAKTAAPAAAVPSVTITSSVGTKTVGATGSVTAKNLSSAQLPAGVSLAKYKISIAPVTPVNGSITSSFCYRKSPITGKTEFHKGLDIAAVEGTPIAAAFAGTVEQTGVSSVYGNYVLLNHGGGLETFYGHCQVVLVKKGDTIKAGQTIAKVGSTGQSTGSHLHFEVRINKIRYNPRCILNIK